MFSTRTWDLEQQQQQQQQQHVDPVWLAMESMEFQASKKNAVHQQQRRITYKKTIGFKQFDHQALEIETVGE